MKKLIFAFVLGILIVPIVFAQGNIFSDVGNYEWFSKYVSAIKDWGVIDGNDDGTFAPDRYINRAEFSKIIYLYDQRVDEKISQSESTPSAPATVMSLEKFNKEPASCPKGWTEAEYGKNWEDSGKYSYRRTCYTSQHCTVMNLELFNAEPKECPRGWNQAEYGIKWEENGKEKYQRVCYLCSD